MNILENVIGACISASVVYTLGILSRNFFPKLYRNLMYKGQDISGNWKSEFEWEGLKGSEEITIEQNGVKIKGSIKTIITENVGKPRTLESKINGELRNNFLVGYYVPTDKRKFGCGSFTLALFSGGNKLKGCCPFQFTDDGALKCMKDYVWVR